jgi:ABC-2 type transport system ATP-binding protein
MNIIEVKEVVKDYSGHRALDHVSLNVEEGKVYGLLGPNGAGKTSLIRILNQITRPDSGEILLEGRPLSEDDVMHMGYLPEERGLYKKMKVLDHIIYLGRLKGMSKADAYREGKKWLDRMELNEWTNKKIEALSKGMAQKVQFISTVVHRPKLLIFDEPFSGFDPVNTEQIKREIMNLNKEGSTILFSTHNMASVEEICDDFTLINKSKAVLQGNVLEIRHRFKKHLYKVRIAELVLAPMPELYTIEGIEPHAMGGTEVTLRLVPGVGIRDVIARLNAEYNLIGFEELLPSMNEVFIETVTDSNEPK